MITAQPIVSGRRQGAIHSIDWPRCPDGSLHHDRDRAWKRLTNLDHWYICRGFTFRQGDLNGAQSGAAERIFGFGKIEPGGDFDGDGNYVPGNVPGNLDWQRWQEQFNYWFIVQGSLGADMRLTYYHGDMDSNGILDASDLLMAQNYIRDNIAPLNNIYWLGDPITHEMTWDPNVQWLPCPAVGSSSPGSGP